MMSVFEYSNPHPKGLHTTDCVVRAVTFGFTEADTWGNGLYGEIRLSSKAVEYIKQTKALYE